MMGQALSSCTPCCSGSAQDNDEDVMDDDFDVDDGAQSGAFSHCFCCIEIKF